MSLFRSTYICEQCKKGVNILSQTRLKLKDWKLAYKLVLKDFVGGRNICNPLADVLPHLEIKLIPCWLEA
jgi:transposase-like protein